jgi:hypothetical protein
VWETYRLVGTVAGHLAAYRHPGLPASVNTAAVAAVRPAGTSVLAQPSRLPAPSKPAGGSWWDPEQTRPPWTSRTQPKTTSTQADWRCMTPLRVNS